jgi:Ca2+-dependent lipid-binding protein
MGKLTVYLDKVTNLADSDGIGSSDPYVKFDLEQDNMILDKDYGSQKSTTKQNDTSPEYGETFWFEIPSLKNMVLRVKIMDNDPLKDDKLGYCKFELDKMDLTSELQPFEKVVDHNIFVKDGKVHLKLAYED